MKNLVLKCISKTLLQNNNFDTHQIKTNLYFTVLVAYALALTKI